MEQFKETEERTEKAKARSESIKLGTKIERNYKTAIQKANAMGAIDNILDNANAENQNAVNQNAVNRDNANANNVNPNNVRNLDYDEINVIKDKNVKNALARAKEAYDARENKNNLDMSKNSHDAGVQTSEKKDAGVQTGEKPRRRRNRR